MKRVAFITGAAGFIGSETACTLAKSGIDIALCDINMEALNKAVEKVVAVGGKAKAYVADVSVYEDIEKAINTAAEDFGRLDIMVHVAGGSARIAGPNAQAVHLVEQDIDVIEKVIKINLFGAIYASRAAAKIMIAQGEGGKIINFASSVGINGLKKHVDYSASKGGVIAMTKSLAKELGPHKINVNAVAPGVVCRDTVDTTTPEGRAYAYGTNLLGEKCTAKDIANMVDFLASEKSNFITGQTYVVDGGRSLSMRGTD